MHVSCLRIKVRNLLQVICMSCRSLIFELPYKSAYDKKISTFFPTNDHYGLGSEDFKQYNPWCIS